MSLFNKYFIFILALFFSFNATANSMSCEVLQKVMYCSGGSGNVWDIKGGSGNNSFNSSAINLGSMPEQKIPQQKIADISKFPTNPILFCSMPRSSVCCKKCGFKKYCKLYDDECKVNNVSQDLKDVSTISKDTSNKFDAENPNQMSQEKLLEMSGPTPTYTPTSKACLDIQDAYSNKMIDQNTQVIMGKYEQYVSKPNYGVQMSSGELSYAQSIKSLQTQALNCK